METENTLTRITRHRSVGSATRHIELHYGKEVRVLGTKITKVVKPEAFMKVGPITAPVEQYAFRVEDKTYARFADAVSIVLKKHGIKINLTELDVTQQYVIKAVKIMNGEEKLIDVTTDFGDAKVADSWR